MRLLRFVVGLLLGLVLFAGCAASLWDDSRDGSAEGSGGLSTTSTGDGGALFTGGAGGGGAAPGCEGECVNVHSSPFDGPTMMWIGPAKEVPPCPPEIAPFVGFEGFAELTVAPHTCPACTCSPAACALPETMHASAAKCPGDGAAALPFDAPAAWQGACTAEDAIPAGLVCGGVACVQSLAIAPPVLQGCQPKTEDPGPFPEPSWGTMARECLITLSDTCPLEGEACAPAPPEGFRLCVYRESADPDNPLNDCPAAYPESFVVYAGPIDSRTCAPCACSEPEGDCAALVSTYSDTACGQVVASVTVASGQGACVDLPNGTALGSKSAAWVIDEHGRCTPSGGGPSGQLAPAGAMTYCCQPSLVPSK